MKKIILILLLITSTVTFSQNFESEWKKVIQFEQIGKTESANNTVLEIYKNAKKKENDPQLIKCFFYLSKFKQVFEENAQTAILEDIKSRIKLSSKPNKALLNCIYANLLQNYLNKNSYKLNNLTELKKEKSEDYLTWTAKNFQTEIELANKNSIVDLDKLRSIPIKKYEILFDISPYTNAEKTTLYDYISENFITYSKNCIENYSVKNKELYGILFLDATSFQTFNCNEIEDKNLKNILILFQRNEKYYLEKKDDKLGFAVLQRFDFINNNYDISEQYYAAVEKLEKNTSNVYLLQELKAKRVNKYFDQTIKSKISYYDKAISLTDSILKTNVNPNAMAFANTIKTKILQKNLSFNLKKIIYPNEEIRAFVNYKNIDSITIKYYKIPAKFDLFSSFNDYNLQDSLVLNYITKNNYNKKYTIQLPVKKDCFSYSTEILLEKLDIGNYLIFIETQNNDGQSLAFAYEKITVTSIMQFSDNEEKNDVIFVLDRKTGKPIEDLKILNNKKIYLSNELGKVKIPKEKYDSKTDYYNKKYDDQLLFIKDNDTLIDAYNRTFLYDNNEEHDQDEYENYEAKAMAFFDRAIYRPGQKMFFKAVLIQNKNGVKSVVPNVTTHIEIKDVNGNVLKEMDLKTNQFGSVSGEFDIPKNGLSGEFELTIDEPENTSIDNDYYDNKEKEHKFWDNVDYEDDGFTFNVEEYKRPTFEITFNKIKANFSVGDIVTITGNAKTLAGSNLTNAKVSFAISKDVRLKNGGYDNYENYLLNEVMTDGNGDFKIQFTSDDAKASKDSVSQINFDIAIKVTDISGETKTGSQRVYVGNKTLELNVIIDSNLNIDDATSLTIVSTTLNNFPIDCKGEIEIINLQKKHFFKQRQFELPELNSISRSEFEKLFPYEPYDESDYSTNEIVIKTIKFDTKEGKDINLDFLKNIELGQYKVIIKSLDSKNNEIKNLKYFNTYSVKNPGEKGSLFTLKDISKPNSDLIEIEIRSQIKDLFINTRTYLEDSINNFTQIQLINGLGKLTFMNSNNNKKNIKFYFLSVWDNQVVTKTESLNKDSLEKKLLIETISMRNKIEPGSTENWSFKILDNKLEAEVLASMYDSSLDQFSQKEWQNVFFYNRSYQNNTLPRFNNYSMSYVTVNNFTFYSRYNIQYSRKPILKTFGFDFGNSKNSYIVNEYVNEIKQSINPSKSAKTITGIVSDELGPIPGANIIIQGTKIGTSTDFDGKFQIKVDVGQQLIISYIGTETKKIIVGSLNNYIIKLNASAQKLDEVVVTAFGIKKENKSLVFSTQNANYKALVQAAPSNIVTALSGKVSGLNIITRNNNVNSITGIVLRGYKSLSGNNQALIIIDGVIVEGTVLNTLDPSDIIDVKVINSSEATILYGLQGANGALIVSTKKMLQEVAKVKTRTNFNETAFFFPHLKTDSEGKVAFSFTTPESLTKWKLRLFAHNKNAETGNFQSEIESQKDVMIMPNMPRFVREKDTIIISAKVINMTNEGKTGVAMLLLYDATTMKTVDVITLNSKNSRSFICKPKESVLVNWTITIPEGLEGLQYKIVAKSGNFSDGEENILPVLSNKILITESIPLWVRENTKKEVVFDNLKNNTSSTLKNHLFTLEYTSNPVWFAIQSLPYLMEYEHECAEQTFARYYSNCIATEIINSSPKISELFESWRKEGKVKSKMEMNAELKSILLAETPWFFESDENARNKQLAILMDSNTLKESTDNTLKKLEQKILPNGGFPWFDGGNENIFISQHILSGIGHLNKMFPKSEAKYETIVGKGIPNLDRQFLEISKLRKEKKMYYGYNDFQFLYTRSFYLKKYPLSSELESLIKVQLEVVKKNWLEYSLYQKAMLALILNRFNEVDFAKKIVTSFKENASHNVTDGMYWIENKNGYYWYQSSVETQALLIEAFSEIDNDKKTINEMKVWLIKNKQANNWSTTKSTTEAIYALMLEGTDWTSIKDNTKFKIGSEKILSKKLTEKDKEAATGYIKMNWKEDEITKEMGSISIENKSDIPGYGGVYWQYFEELENVKNNTTTDLMISKELYKKVKTTEGEKLVEIANEKLKLGDLLTVRLIIKTENDLEFVHLKDLRASCFEPVDVLSGYKWQSLSYYMSTKDVATHFFFDTIKKGIYVLEYDVRINNLGSFNNGIATLQSMYAPEFSAHSVSSKIKISE